MRIFTFICKFSFSVVLFLVFSSVLWWHPPAFSAETLRCSTIAPENSEWGEILKSVGEKVKRRTGGKLRISWTFGGIEGDDPELAKKLKEGKLDCIAATGNGASYIIPFVRVLELPYLIRSFDEVDYIKEEVSKFFRKIAHDYNVKFIWFSEVGFAYAFSKTPIMKISDLKGKKLWIWENDIMIEKMGKTLRKIAGVELVRIPIQDVQKYLRILDIIPSPPYALLTLGWDKFISYYSLPPVAFVFNTVVFNLRSFEELTPEEQKIVEEETKNALMKLSQVIRDNNIKTLQILERKGVKKVIFSGSELKVLEDAFKKYVWLSLKDNLYPSWLLRYILTKISEFRTKKKRLSYLDNKK